MAIDALGLIETKGLVCALEAADIMLKSSDVQLIGKEINGSYITIIVKGDIAAVRIAVSNGTSAAKRTGKVVSSHVIPEPDQKLFELFNQVNKKEKPIISETTVEKKAVEKIPEPENKLINNGKKPAKIIEDLNREPQKKRVIRKLKQKTDNPKTEKKERQSGEKKNYEFNTLFDSSANDTISRLRREALNIKPVKEKSNKEKKSPDSHNYESMNVHQLRKMARDYNNFPIKGREISKANRQELIAYFNNL